MCRLSVRLGSGNMGLYPNRAQVTSWAALFPLHPALVFKWLPPKAGPETGPGEQVAYLGGEPGTHVWRVGSRMGREGLRSSHGAGGSWNLKLPTHGASQHRTCLHSPLQRRGSWGVCTPAPVCHGCRLLKARGSQWPEEALALRGAGPGCRGQSA